MPSCFRLAGGSWTQTLQVCFSGQLSVPFDGGSRVMGCACSCSGGRNPPFPVTAQRTDSLQLPRHAPSEALIAPVCATKFKYLYVCERLIDKVFSGCWWIFQWCELYRRRRALGTGSNTRSCGSAPSQKFWVTSEGIFPSLFASVFSSVAPPFLRDVSVVVLIIFLNFFEWKLCLVNGLLVKFVM